jgi:hypothetical protein
MKKILLVLLIAGGLTSCFKEEKEFTRSYVLSYYGMDNIDLGGNYYEKTIYILTFTRYELGHYKSTGAKKQVYDALCEKHGDMTFLREQVTWGPGGPVTVEFLGIDFLSIDITSDSAFDEEHPAGVSLGDIVLFNSYSVKPYIDSGYTSTYDNDVYHPVNKHLSDLTQDDLILIGKYKYSSGDPDYIGKLTFDKEPTLSKIHTFTVTMTADDGRVFTDSIEMTFE